MTRNITLTVVITTVIVFTNTNLLAETNKFDAGFFNTDSKLYYEIGGAKRFTQPITEDNHTALDLGLKGSSNIGYSCGAFDYGASFKNLMNDFKNGVDNVKNVLAGGVQAGISSLPLATLQRMMPGAYDMFQEWSDEANTKIDISTKSCEQAEREIANGENPYTDFLKISKTQTYKDEAKSGNDVVAAKKKAEENAGDNGVISFGGKKVGGVGQPPLQIIASSTKAGYNFLLGHTNPLLNTNAPSGSAMQKLFPTHEEAKQFAIDVVGEFEINNKKPSTKVGLGLTPKILIEREKAEEQLKNGEFDELGIDPTIIKKLSDNYNSKTKNAIYSNILDDIAIERTIIKAFSIRDMLVASSQDSDESSSSSPASKEYREASIKKIDDEIKTIIFKRKIKQDLANNTMMSILKTPSKTPTENNYNQEESFLLPNN